MLLNIDKVNVRVIGVAVAQELHKSPPVNFAATTSRSLDVHEVLGGGNACPNDIEILSKLNIKKASDFFEIVFFSFIKLNLIYVYVFV